MEEHRTKNEALVTQPVKLTEIQIIALRACMQQVAIFQQQLARVITECGLDPSISYDINNEGVATPKTVNTPNKLV